MPKFRLRPDHPDVDLFQPAGGLDSIRVESGKTIEVPGVLVTSRPEPKEDDEPAPPPLPDDAYIVATNGEERTWPHAVWELVEDKPAVPAKVKEH